MDLKELGLQKIQFNINDRIGQSKELFAKQGDYMTRGLLIQLLDNNVIADTTGIDCVFFAKSDGDTYMINATPVDTKKGLYQVIFTPSILKKKENMPCEIWFMKGEQFISTFKFYIKVHETFVTDEEISESDEVKPVVNALIEVLAAEKDRIIAEDERRSSEIERENDEIERRRSEGIRSQSEIERQIDEDKRKKDEKTRQNDESVRRSNEKDRIELYEDVEKKLSDGYFKGDKGDIPKHQWNNTSLRFEKEDGSWGSYVNLKGTKGDKGDPGSIEGFKGIITMWSGDLGDLPDGWVLCDGSNDTPDLRDRFILGASNNSDIGDKGGSHSKTLLDSNLPPHRHNFDTDSAGNHDHEIRYEAMGGNINISSTGYKLLRRRSSKDDYSGTNKATDSTGSHTHSGQTDLTGSGSSFDVRPKYYMLAFIMYKG